MSTNDRIKIGFTRQEFYDKLWSIPTSKLAAELGCSDVTIGKVCKAFRIPKPYVGYWAKLNNGNKPKRTRLPKDESADKEKLTLYKYLTEKPYENAIPIEAQFDLEIIELLSPAKSLGPVIVPDICGKLHPLVRQWRTEIAKRKASEKFPWDQRACIKNEPMLAIHVSSEQFRFGPFDLSGFERAQVTRSLYTFEVNFSVSGGCRVGVVKLILEPGTTEVTPPTVTN